MTINLVNVGVPQVANRAFVALAVEAGIEATIRSIVGLALDKISLLAAVKTALQLGNPVLADALNVQTLDAILDYMQLTDGAIVQADQLPPLLNESGPVSVSAARDGGVAGQVNVTYSEPPVGYVGEIYLDGVLAKISTAQAAGGFVNDVTSGVAAGGHTIRVLFRNPSGAMTRFGPLVTIE